MPMTNLHNIRDYLPGDEMVIPRGENEFRVVPPNYGLTFLWDNKVYCVAGIIDVGGQRGTAWAIVNEIPRGAMKHLFRFARDYLASNHDSFLRVDALALSSAPKAVRTLEFLGFEIEATLESFDDGRDITIGVYRG